MRTIYTRMGIAVIGVSVALSTAARAQVITDGTVGVARTLTGPAYGITSDLGRMAGSNLFHSFSQFNISAGESATFSGPASITNIISRVTDGQASSIDGLLRSTISGANLYLLNPKGIMFGPNASLDISGSFYASSADYLKLGPGGRFDATTPANSVLTVDEPSAFGFVGSTPGAISIDGSRLSVPGGKTLSIVGGDIAITNSADTSVLSAPGGRINLASVASAGELVFTPSGIDSSRFSAMGAISLTNTGDHDLYTSPGDISTTTGEASMGSGSIYISGGRFVTDNGWIFSYTPGQIDGKGIYIEARDGAKIRNRSWIGTDTYASGNAGDISISTSNLNVSDFSLISASTHDAGNGGKIDVRSANSVNISNYSFISSTTSGAGNAGSIAVEAKDLALQGYGVIATNAEQNSGQGGDISITATGSVVVAGYKAIDDSKYLSCISSETSGSHNAGNIAITTPGLSVSNLGYISASTTGSGNGGSIKIENVNDVTTVNISNDGFISNATLGSGNAGNITIDAKEVSIADGGLLSSKALSPVSGKAGDITVKASGTFTVYSAIVSTKSEGSKDAGNITIATSDLTVSDKGLIDSGTTGSGNGGAINIENVNNATVVNILKSSQVTGLAAGTGNAGSVTIDAKDVAVKENSGILTAAYGAGADQGGNITIAATGSLSVSGSTIASNTYGIGKAGDVTITTPSLAVFDNGSISSSTSGMGNGGTIKIENVSDATTVTISNNGSILSETFGAGNAGNIMVEAKNLTLQAGGVVSTFAHSDSGQGGEISITATGSLIVSGYKTNGNGVVSSSINSDTTGSHNAGNITIATPKLTVSDSGYISSSSHGSGNGGSITVSNADTVDVCNSGSIVTAAIASGNAGNIRIDTKTLTLLNAGQIVALAEGGNAGNISLSASGSIKISGYIANDKSTDFSGIRTTTSGAGKGGMAQVATPNLIMDNLGEIDASTTNAGDGGDIILNVGRLSMTDGAAVSAITTDKATGKGGVVTINATDSIVISGLQKLNDSIFRSGIFLQSLGQGDGGSLFVKTGAMLMTEGADIDSTASGRGNAGSISIEAGNFTMSDAWLWTSSLASGKAGSILLIAGNALIANGASVDNSASDTGNAGTTHIKASNSIVLSDSEIVNKTTGSGHGGSITLSAPFLTVTNGGYISAESMATGNAGNLFVSVSNKMVLNGGAITTATKNADGGSITIDPVLMDLRNSSISTSVFGGTGNGGNISLAADSLVLDHSNVIARAVGGNGGNISIRAGAFLQDPASVISASSQLGLSGTIGISAPLVDLSGSLVSLPEGMLGGRDLAPRQCAAEDESGGSFVVAPEVRRSKPGRELPAY